MGFRGIISKITELLYGDDEPINLYEDKFSDDDEETLREENVILLNGEPYRT